MSKYKSEITKLADTTALTNKEIAKVVGCSEKTVLKYAGSYITRTKAKTDFDESAWEIQKTILLPDIHADSEFKWCLQLAPIDVRDLALDIEERGLIQPVTVRPYNEQEQAYRHEQNIFPSKRRLQSKMARNRRF